MNLEEYNYDNACPDMSRIYWTAQFINVHFDAITNK